MSIPSVMKLDTSYSIPPEQDLSKVRMEYGHLIPRMRWKFHIEQNSTSMDTSSQDQSTITGTSASRKSKLGYWYLGTPYSLHPEGTLKAYSDAIEVQAKLASNDIIAYSPIVMGHSIASALTVCPDHDFWMKYNGPLLDGATGLLIVMMPGWTESRGLKEEYNIFVALDKPVLFVNYPLSQYNIDTLKITISQFDL